MRFYLLGKESKMDLASWFVCLLGVGIVFIGLTCLILLCFIVRVFSKENTKPVSSKAPATQASNVSAPAVIENRQEILAAVSAALAEELGEDVSSIRILSFKKIGG